MNRLKTDDLVYVTTGKSKGLTGRILKIFRDQDKVIVEGVNLVKRHKRATPQNPEGGIIESEAAIHVSNVMLVDGKTEKPTRIKAGTDKDGKKVRVSVKSGTVLD